MGLILLFGGPGAPVVPDVTAVLTNFPTFAVEVDFGDGWTDLLGLVRSPMSYNRGRQRETDRPATGTASVSFNNKLGELDRDNPSSPYYPNVRPNLPIRISAGIETGLEPFTIGGSFVGGPDVLAGGPETIALYTGRTEGGPQSFPEGGALDTIDWTAADGFKRLNLDKGLVGTASSELTGARINRILDMSSPVWPADMRDIDPGTRQMAAVSFGDPDPASNHLDYCLLTAESEGGVFFISADGKATFRDAEHAHIIDATPFGDIPGEQRYRDVRFEDDDKAIRNAITVTSSAQPDEVAEDVASIAEHGRIDMSIATDLGESIHMADLALSALSRYAEPHRRIIAMEIGTNVTDWRNVLRKEIGDRVVVRRRTTYGTTIEQTSTIEGIHLQAVNPSDVRVTWSLSPAVTPQSPNLLTVNQASLEVDETGWAAETNCNIDSSTEWSFIGARSLRLIPFTSALVSAITTPDDGIDVTSGITYNGRAYLHSLYPITQGHLEIDWLDSGEALLSTSTGDTVSPVGLGEPYLVTVSAAAPVGSAHPVLRVVFENAHTIYTNHADAISFRAAS